MNFQVAALINPKREPRIFSLYGAGGTGKTTLLANQKDPFLLLTEDGTSSIEALPPETRKNVFTFTEEVEGKNGKENKRIVFKSTQDVLDGIDWLVSQPHSRKSIGMDSVTRFDALAREEVLADEPNVKNKSMQLAFGGYGKAYGRVAYKHELLIQKILKLKKDRQLDVFLIHHERIEEINPIDANPYFKANLRLHVGGPKAEDSNIQAMYFEMSDVVGYVRQEFFVNDGKAMASGRRLIYCDLVPFAATKCRGLPIREPLEFTFDKNPFEQYL